MLDMGGKGGISYLEMFVGLKIRGGNGIEWIGIESKDWWRIAWLGTELVMSWKWDGMVDVEG